ncbi:MAG TPA: hypothetical protein VN688_07360 [Gemmataceae bacterium]|nr:hypothetical protein [Gemmataceae bacterium]
MIRLSKPLLTAGFLLILLVPMNQARADDCCGASGGSCGGCSSCGIGGRLSAWANYEPSVTYYAPYPYWWPNYFAGPPYTSYQQVQYFTSPAESAQIVKERILAINSANPALLPLAKEPLPFPKPDPKKPADKLP